MPVQLGASPATSRSGRNKEPHLAEQLHRAADRKRLARIQEQYQHKSPTGLLKWRNTIDRLSAARALGRLLAAEGTTHVPINAMKEIWRRENNGSEFHVHRYALSPMLDLVDRAKRQLAEEKVKIKLVKPYADRARFIATHKGLDPIQSEIEIFRPTSFWGSSETNLSPNVYEGAYELAQLIHGVAQKVCRESDFAGLLQRMRRLPGQWDLERLNFQRARMACVYASAYQSTYEHWAEVPSLPHVPLVRLLHASHRVRFKMSRSRKRQRNAQNPPARAPRNFGSFECTGVLHIFREIALTIGPTTAANAIGPMFESRVQGEFVADIQQHGFTSGTLDLENVDKLEVLQKDALLSMHSVGGEYKAVLLDEIQSTEEGLLVVSAAIAGKSIPSPFFWAHTPLGDDHQHYENYYVSWTPVDPAHVAHWLGQDEEGSVAIVGAQAASATKSSNGPWWYPSPLVAHDVEEAIYSGNLECALRTSVEKLREKFDAYSAAYRDELEEQTAHILAQLRADPKSS